MIFTRRLILLAVIVLTGATTVFLLSQRPEDMSIQKVRDNLFVISGGGGNTAVFIRPDGVVLIDSKIAGGGQRLLDLVRSVTDKPITHIVNTHHHFDHVGNNGSFPAVVEVVAHENAAARMPPMKEFADPAKKHGLADRTFTDRMTLFSGPEAIDLYYFGPAHTDGDAFVVFRTLRVMHAGDTFPGPNPIARDGGSAREYPATMSKVVSAIKEVDTVIPGHGPIATWQAFADNVAAMRAR